MMTLFVLPTILLTSHVQCAVTPSSELRTELVTRVPALCTMVSGMWELLILHLQYVSPLCVTSAVSGTRRLMV